MSIERIHYIGIGGVGMSALAQIDIHRGRRVSGSDAHEGPILDRLRSLGAEVFVGHDAENIRRSLPDMVVYTDAVRGDNPELAEARARHIPIMRRAEYLGAIMDGFAGPRIAVAGTHGKTTTTAMLAEILCHAGMDPTVLIGGDYAPFHGNLRLGRSGVFITEACEAFRSFHHLRPDIAIITNVEADHLDCYDDFAGVVQGFVTFAHGIRKGGTLVIRAEGDGEKAVTREARALGHPVIRFAFTGNVPAELSATLHESSGGTEFELRWEAAPPRTHRSTLAVPGQHNVLNALAALGAAWAVGIDPSKAADALRHFRGVGRRFELLGERNGITVVDDYAHHPTEIAATYQAARSAYPGRRLIAVFQPHLYSRTRDFRAEFAAALGQFDLVVLTDIYVAREGAVEGGDALSLAREIAIGSPRTPLLVELDKERIPALLGWIARAGDVILILGAGDIRAVGEQFVAPSGPGGPPDAA